MPNNPKTKPIKWNKPNYGRRKFPNPKPNNFPGPSKPLNNPKKNFKGRNCQVNSQETLKGNNPTNP